MDNENVVIGRVTIPVKRANPNFKPSDLLEAVDFYPEYDRLETAAGFIAVSRINYLTLIIKEAAVGSDYEEQYSQIISELLKKNPSIKKFVKGSA